MSPKDALTDDLVIRTVFRFCAAREWMEEASDGTMYALHEDSLPEFARALRAALKARHADKGAETMATPTNPPESTQEIQLDPAGEEWASVAADAARYRWLRRQNWNDATLCVVMCPSRAVKLGHDCPAGDRLDAAIDAAMQGRTS
jgi:hypothetical protein